METSKFNFEYFYYYIIKGLKSILSAVYNVWNYNIYTTTDKQSITLANVMIGMILMIVGFRIAKKMSQLTKEKILDTMDIDNNVKVILETIVRYIFIIFITIIILDISHVPLTSLTLIGSALAISVGLGSQNILNNFISGLIIMIEQPIRVGDYIEIDTIVGRVINIGARCVNILTSDNIDILVPNSVVLQNKVINWTFNNDKVKISISFPVKNSLNSRLVEEKVMKAIEMDHEIMISPKPQLYFSSYYQEEINMKFDLTFWIEFNRADQKRITSNLQHAIKNAVEDAENEQKRL